MENEQKKYPSLPSNYVTLVQLQERWLMEQQRKQREKEEEEERERREKEDQQRKLEEQENQKKQHEIANTSYRRRPIRRNCRNEVARSSVTVGASDRKSEESQIATVVVGDGEMKVVDLGKKKKKNWTMRRKPRAKENLIGGEKKLLPESGEAAEKIPVVLSARDGVKEGVTSEFHRNGKNLVVNYRVWEKKVPVDRSAEIGRKFGDLSLSGGSGGNERDSRNMHSGQWRYNSGSERFNHGKLQKPRGSNLVWVKKEDTSDVNAA